MNIEIAVTPPAAPPTTETEVDLANAHHLFVGKTIRKMDTSICNKVQFLFTDGTRVALHIDCDWRGLPDVTACIHCCEITDGTPNHGAPLLAMGNGITS